MSQKILPKYQSLISGVVGGFTWGIVGVMLPVISKFTEYTGILNGLLIISLIPIVMCIWVKEIPKRQED